MVKHTDDGYLTVNNRFSVRNLANRTGQDLGVAADNCGRSGKSRADRENGESESSELHVDSECRRDKSWGR